MFLDTVITTDNVLNTDLKRQVKIKIHFWNIMKFASQINLKWSDLNMKKSWFFKSRIKLLAEFKEIGSTNFWLIWL